MNMFASVCAASIAMVLAFATVPAHATSFPVSGTITVGGNSGALPSGGTFGNSTYDAATGQLSTGHFTFPASTVSASTPVGPAVIHYLLSQTDTSTGQVASDGVAALTTATLRLEVTSVTVQGFPFPVGTCRFAPIEVDLAGSGSSAGLEVEDMDFTIPPVASSDCGGNGDTINSAIASGSNSMRLSFSGDFTPPADNDKIFIDGFDA